MHTRGSSRPHEAFTLIELLVVVAIIAIIAVVVVIVLNPAELLRQSRDADRITDMDTLAHALSLYQTDQGGATTYTMGNASSVYISIPDPNATTSAGTNCASLGLPALPSGYVYHCAGPNYYRASNGTGWIPVNLSLISSGSPLGSLPVDPTNTSSTGLYYVYYASGNQFEVTSLFESSKYKTQYAQAPLDPNYPEVDARGSSLSVSPLYSPTGLVGYWGLDEGAGAVTLDQSGNGDTGTLINNPTWTGGKVNKALSFNGTNQYTTVPDVSSLRLTGSWTISAWVNFNVLPTANNTFVIVQKNDSSDETNYAIVLDNGDECGIPGVGWIVYFSNISTGVCDEQLSSVNTNTWYDVTGVWDASSQNLYLYINGQFIKSFNSGGVFPVTDGGFPLGIGASTHYGNNEMSGTVDDVRVYNRAFSAAEALALYNAEK